MSAGWEIGDLALCVDVSDKHYPHLGRNAIAGRRLRLGDTYRVDAVMIHRVTGETVLLMRGEPYTAGAWRFRKILPDKHEACETEFITLLNRIKQPVEAERSALFMGGK